MTLPWKPVTLGIDPPQRANFHHFPPSLPSSFFIQQILGAPPLITSCVRHGGRETEQVQSPPAPLQGFTRHDGSTCPQLQGHRASPMERAHTSAHDSLSLLYTLRPLSAPFGAAFTRVLSLPLAGWPESSSDHSSLPSIPARWHHCVDSAAPWLQR